MGISCFLLYFLFFRPFNSFKITFLLQKYIYFQGFAYVRNNSTSSGGCYGIAFLDTPGDTNPHTYKVQGLSENGSSYALVVNRRVGGTGFSLSSSITAMEVSA